MRMKAVEIGKDLRKNFDPLEMNPEEGETPAQKKSKKAKTMMLIVNALGDFPLRAVMFEGPDCPRKIGQNL